MFRDQRWLQLHWQDGSKIKGSGPCAEGWWKVCDSKFISSLYTNTPNPFLVLILVWFNWCKERFTINCCLNLDFLWRLMNFIRAVAYPSGIFLFMVSDAIGKKSLEYMNVQILDSFSARMRQQIPPNRRNSCFARCTCMKVITCGTCMKA